MNALAAFRERPLCEGALRYHWRLLSLEFVALLTDLGVFFSGDVCQMVLRLQQEVCNGLKMVCHSREGGNPAFFVVTITFQTNRAIQD